MSLQRLAVTRDSTGYTGHRLSTKITGSYLIIASDLFEFSIFKTKKLRENSKVGTQLLLAEIEIRKPWIFCGKKGGKLTTDEHHFIISYSPTCFPSAKISFSSLFFGRGGGDVTTSSIWGTEI